jgi:hypothetical protein
MNFKTEERAARVCRPFSLVQDLNSGLGGVYDGEANLYDLQRQRVGETTVRQRDSLPELRRNRNYRYSERSDKGRKAVA